MEGPGYLSQAGSFLISTLFELYILIVLLRLLFQYLRMDFYNPVSQFIVRASNPVLRPLRRFIPGYRGIDMATLVLLLALSMLEYGLLGLIMGHALGLAGLLVLSVAKLLDLLLNVFLFAIIIQVILSWLAPGSYNAVTQIVYGLSEPLLRPARQILPPMGGLDLSPLIVLVLIKLTSILVIGPLLGLAMRLM